MDAILGISVLIMVLGLFVGLAGVVALIVMALSKKELKTSGIITGSGFGVFVLAALVILIVSISNDENATTTASYPTSSSDAQSSEAAEEVDDTEYEITDEQREEFNEEYDEKMEEAREEREAEEGEEESDESHLTKDGRDPMDFSEYRNDVAIQDIERNPEEYQNEWIAFEGRVIQVIEGDDITTAYRIAVDDDIDRVVYLEVLTITLEERLLEDDHVQVHGSFYDLVTYETVMGANQTIPAFNAHGERIELQ